MGSFKLGRMTFSSLFKKPETLLYPARKKEPPAGLKGHIVIIEGDCILCSMCARTCPTGAIVVSKPDRTWVIDRFRCVQCASCTRACPKHCLKMDPAYTAPMTSKHVDSFDIPEHEEPKMQEK